MEWNQADKLYMLVKENQGLQILRDRNILRLVEMLLSETLFDSDQLTGLIENDMLDVFSTYAKIGDRFRMFYERFYNDLSPQKKAGAFAKKIDDIQLKISIYKNNVQELIILHDDLLNNEKELMAKNEEFVVLEQKICKLNDLQKSLSPEHFERMMNEICEMELDVQNKKEQNESQKLLQSALRREISRLEMISVDLSLGTEQLRTGIDSYFDNIETGITNELDKKEKDLDELKIKLIKSLNDYDILIDKVAVFTEEAKTLQEINLINTNVFLRIFEEDLHVSSGIKEGLSIDIEDIKKHIYELEVKIRKELEEMEGILKGVIFTAEELNKQILKRNKTIII